MKNKALKRLIYGLSALLLTLPFLTFANSYTHYTDTVLSTGYKLKTVIIDPGHGNHHSGPGTFSMGASGSYSFERNVTLAVALKLQKAMEKELPEVKTVLTRTTEDDVSLQNRAAIANENKGDLFISIHCNALSDRHIREVIGHKHHEPVYRTVSVADRSGKGVLMLVYGFHRTTEEEKAIQQNLIEDDSGMNAQFDPSDPAALILLNEYKRKYRSQSIHFAELLNNEFVETDGRHSEGIREQGVLVLCHSAMPAVLIETGYINNPDDEAYLNSEDGQNQIVATIIRALKSYKAELEQAAQ